jgi:hypothetical protein
MPTIFLIGIGHGTNNETYLDPRTNTIKKVPFNIDFVRPSREQKRTEGKPSFTDVFRL